MNLKNKSQAEKTLSFKFLIRICKYVVLPIFIILLLYIILNMTSNMYCSKNQNEFIEENQLRYKISYPNTYIGENRTYELGFYKYMTNNLLYKNLSGKILPYGNVEEIGGLVGVNSGVISTGRMSKAISKLEDTKFNKRKSDISGLRELLFIYPNSDLEDVVDDRKILTEIDSDKILEISISFDKPYSLNDVKSEIGEDFTTFYWVDDKFNLNTSNSKDSINDICLENDVFGIKLLNEDGKKVANAEKTFVQALQELQDNKHATFPYNKLYLSIAGENRNLEVDDIKINGAVLVGNKDELSHVLSNKNIKYIFIGSIVDKY
ncbi:anti sigma factor C-terminal domain-containing protein [Clostridium uliginosum]|uniref:Sigma factor regulator N-terminal n=1 Tax=Clostridium uliginosum TaxID=119641 RepID=A0A1I1NZ91_9CLOT|nr:anti sigma factor C-terminal domain-containing protein [Clostridium uliginosum]SFD03001.1 Sigma factor regulator N-terminal [Clostridium uliginosum]